MLFQHNNAPVHVYDVQFQETARENPNFMYNFITSGEAHLHLNGFVNKYFVFCIMYFVFNVHKCF